MGGGEAQHADVQKHLGGITFVYCVLTLEKGGEKKPIHTSERGFMLVYTTILFIFQQRIAA